MLGTGTRVAVPVLRATLAPAERVDGGGDVEAGTPFTVRAERDAKADAVLVQLCLVRARGDPRLADKAVAPVAEHELPVKTEP